MKKSNIKVLAQKYYEWKNDPIKWIEECVQLPSVGGYDRMKLYEPQKRVLRSFYEDHHLILLKTRQTGFSTLFQLIAAHTAIFYDNVKMGVLSKDGSEATDFNRKTMDIIYHLKYKEIFFPGFRKESEQTFELNNGSGLKSKAISRSNPGAVGRGSSYAILFIDEAAFIEHVDTVWTSAAPALSKAQTVAKAKGVPFGTVIISTPNKKAGTGQWFYDRWRTALYDAEESIFKAHKIHWKEISDFADDPTWYETQCKLLHNNPNKIAQELDLQFVSSDDAIFDDVIQKKLNDIVEPKDTQIINLPGGKLKIFNKKFNPKAFHLIGVDSASAAGSDYSTVEVFDYQTMNQVAEYQGKTEPKIFANKVVKTIDKMFPKNLIIVENSGGYGISVINEMQFDEHKTYNLFGELKIKDSNKKNKSKTEFKLGLNTNSKSRPLILDAMYDYVVTDPFAIKSEKLALEILSLTRNAQNKIEADTGFHDDLVMAYGFICYVRKYDRDIITSPLTSSGGYDNTLLETGRIIEDANYSVEDLASSKREETLLNLYPEYERFKREVKKLFSDATKELNSTNGVEDEFENPDDDITLDEQMIRLLRND